MSNAVFDSSICLTPFFFIFVSYTFDFTVSVFADFDFLSFDWLNSRFKDVFWVLAPKVKTAKQRSRENKARAEKAKAAAAAPKAKPVGGAKAGNSLIGD